MVVNDTTNTGCWCRKHFVGACIFLAHPPVIDSELAWLGFDELEPSLTVFRAPLFFFWGGGGRFTVFNRLRKGYASYSMVLKSWACTRVGNIVVSRKTDRHTHTYSCKEVEQRPAEMFLRSLSVAAERAMIYGSGTLINNYFQAITNRFYGRVLRPVDDARCEIGRRRRPYE